MVTLSKEQQLFVEKALEGHNILVDACIGSGKTTAIQQLCEAYPERTSILYLTYNRLLKIDAKAKITQNNAVVSNYHGYAYSCLCKLGIKVGISDIIQTFNKVKPPIKHFDVLLLDEYQDIETELATMLNIIKEANPGIQIIAVGDMEQKIYDKTTLEVPPFINEFLGEHITLEFTQCFRLSAGIAENLGRIWNKKIVGVNANCKVETMYEEDVIEFLKEQRCEDILCLGARLGSLSDTLNRLEDKYPGKFNKTTVYASINETDRGRVAPTEKSAIFTTFDSSKGLERKVCAVFDFNVAYWSMRLSQPQVKYNILRNIFCVAASRGKEHIIFVIPDAYKNISEIPKRQKLLTPEDIMKGEDSNKITDDCIMSQMFDFKFKEQVENAYALLKVNRIMQEDNSVIDIDTCDGLIDLSPCVGTYQEANYFNKYEIDESIKQTLVACEKEFLYKSYDINWPLEKKILFQTSVETNQNRYVNQVDTPFVKESEREKLINRLSQIFVRDEAVQVVCKIPFAYPGDDLEMFRAVGIMDVVKDGTVYELKFVSELTHEHFLQCASYMVASGLKRGILWNVRDNSMYEIEVPDKMAFLDAVTIAITKGAVNAYYPPRKLREDFDDYIEKLNVDLLEMSEEDDEPIRMSEKKKKAKSEKSKAKKNGPTAVVKKPIKKKAM
ncbi:MAG: AAA family ATPase [Lachnospiraceae bacterium]|nr:AAA family ATPase [Lachnospiraceae bacterium]